MITVKYWRGTMQLTGKAKTYRGAMKLASKNQNAYSPQFYDSTGRELLDDGNGLCYKDEAENETGSHVTRIYAVIG